MKKIAYIIPGFQESHTRQKGYDKIAGYFAERDIKPIHVEIDWNSPPKGDFLNYIRQFRKQYKPGKAQTYILGFSFGAFTAFLSESQTRPKALILCSLSPFFKEDIPRLRPSWRKNWEKNYLPNDYSFNQLAQKIKAKTYICVGDKEGLECEGRARGAKRYIKQSSLTIAKGARHRVSQKEYLISLKKIIAKL
ncbi:MAG TPA: hypothetical protein VF941_00455 [Clostridia bacterium]